MSEALTRRHIQDGGTIEIWWKKERVSSSCLPANADVFPAVASLPQKVTTTGSMFAFPG